MKLPKAKTDNIVVQELDKELLIYYLSTNRGYSLNETSKIVFEACDGQKSVEDLKREYNFSDDLIYLALDELQAKGLLTGYENDHFAGLSRREVIRKVGLASLIALPFVSSLVAPTAASAASLRANGVACTAASQCTSNCCGRTQGGTLACSAVGADANGLACNANCECATNCCGFGNTCFDTTSKRATGASCRVNCECANGTCGAGNVCN